MKEQGLLEEIVTRVERDLKGLLAKVGKGEVGAQRVEHEVQQVVRSAGSASTAMLLEAVDERLACGQAVHDRRTRTIVTRFGACDLTRSRLADGRYPLDEALGLEGRHGWTRWVQEAASLLACEKAFESCSDLLDRLLAIPISAPAVEQVAWLPELVRWLLRRRLCLRQ